MERQKILNPLTGRMVYADGVVAKSIPKMKKKVSLLEGAIQRKTTTKIAEKKEAVGKLSGAIKRTLAKKPEPAPPPQPRRVYGWEDLPDDIKDKISGIVKKNEYERRGGKNVDDMIKYIMKVSNYYNLRLKKKTIMDMDKNDLYDFAYKGELDKMIDDAVKVGLVIRLEQIQTGDMLDNIITINGKMNENGDIKEFTELLTYPDYGDNLRFFDYLINHPVNRFTLYQNRKGGFILHYFSVFLGDDIIRTSNNDEYEIFTLVETHYSNDFIDENGKKVKAHNNSASIPLRVFHIKLPKIKENDFQYDIYNTDIKRKVENLRTWRWALEFLQERDMDYNERGDVLEYERPDKNVFPELYYAHRNSFQIKRPVPDFKKP